MESVQCLHAALFPNARKIFVSECQVNKWGHSKNPTPKTDVLVFLTNKRLLAGTIYIRFLIYLKAIQGQKWKKSTIQLLPWNQDFAGFFLTIALKQLSKQNSTNRSPVLSMVLQLCQPIASSFLVISSLTIAFKFLVISIMSRCGTLETAVAVAHKSHHCPLPQPHS